MFLSLKVSGEDSYIQGCAFHDGFSPAIGVFGTEGLSVDDNIVHHTVGEGTHCTRTVNVIQFSGVRLFKILKCFPVCRYQNLGQQYNSEEEPGDDDAVAWIISGQRGVLQLRLERCHRGPSSQSPAETTTLQIRVAACLNCAALSGQRGDKCCAAA